MPRPADPFADTTRLFIDGSNLLHALAHGGTPLPAAALIGRIRALVPPGIAVTIVLDGPPAPGAHERRVTSGIEVRHANRNSADDVLRVLVGPAAEGTLVVSDDHDLRTSLRLAGARLAGSAWLASRLARQRLDAPAAGRARPPARAPGGPGERGRPSSSSGNRRPPPGSQPDPDPDGEAVKRWAPGRGATRKTGNPKRGQPPR